MLKYLKLLMIMNLGRCFYFFEFFNFLKIYNIISIFRWNMLSEQYFKSTTWPSVDNIESMIPNESMKSIFLILYKEMYFRHIYASIQVKTN